MPQGKKPTARQKAAKDKAALKKKATTVRVAKTALPPAPAGKVATLLMNNPAVSVANEELISRICTSIANGAPPPVAATAAGVPDKTYYRWNKRGELEYERIDGDVESELTPGEELYLLFYIRVNEALASCETNLVGHVVEAATDDWRAAAWILERRFRDRYAQRVEQTGPGGAPLINNGQIVILTMPDNGRSSVAEVAAFQEASRPAAVGAASLAMPEQDLLSSHLTPD